MAAIDFVSVGRRRNELTYNQLSMIDAGAFVHYPGPTLLSFGLTLSKTSVLSSLTWKPQLSTCPANRSDCSSIESLPSAL